MNIYNHNSGLHCGVSAAAVTSVLRGETHTGAQQCGNKT
jgi:hypothetical protein